MNFLVRIRERNPPYGGHRNAGNSDRHLGIPDQGRSPSAQQTAERFGNSASGLERIDPKMFNRTNVKVASLFDSLSSKTSGGAGRVNAMVGSALARSGTDFTYILLRDETPRYPHEGKTIALGEPFVFGFGPKKIISLFRTGWKTARLCRKNEIRVLIGHGDFFYMVAVLAKYFGSGAKTVSVVHSTIGVWPGFVRKTLLAFLRKSDLVVFVSDEERLTFRDEYGFENGRLVTIHNGIDTENVRKSSASSAPEIPKLPNRFRFVSLGRLV